VAGTTRLELATSAVTEQQRHWNVRVRGSFRHRKERSEHREHFEVPSSVPSSDLSRLSFAKSGGLLFNPTNRTQTDWHPLGYFTELRLARGIGI
jgi:hypothetical protein